MFSYIFRKFAFSYILFQYFIHGQQNITNLTIQVDNLSCIALGTRHLLKFRIFQILKMLYLFTFCLCNDNIIVPQTFEEYSLFEYLSVLVKS